MAPPPVAQFVAHAASATTVRDAIYNHSHPERTLTRIPPGIATRIAYALILLLNSILSWLTMTDWAVKKLQGVLLDYVTIDCAGKQCFGFTAVHRVNFALGCFHAIHAILLLGVNSSKDRRAPIQNGFWGPKIIAWLGLIVLTFLIPNTFFEVWGNYVAFGGAMLFLLLGLVLLVDLAHTWAEHCIEKIEDTDSKLWRSLLIGSTLGMYLGSIAITIVMYIFFAQSNCSMNQAAITVSQGLFWKNMKFANAHSRSTLSLFWVSAPWPFTRQFRHPTLVLAWLKLPLLASTAPT